MKVRRNDAVPAYRPSVQSTQQNSATTSTGSRGSRDLYSAYRPKSDRTNDVVPTVNAGAQASHDYTAYQPANAGGLSSASDARRGDQFTSQNHSAYKPVDNSNHATVTDMPTTQYVRNQRLAQSRMDTNAGYKPAAGGDTSNRGDQFQNRSGYKPGADGNHSTVAPMPTTRSMRDRKLAQDRMAATSSYRPAVTKPHFTYSDHKAPKGYRPPTYREGHYYYSHPHYTRPCSFGFWSLDYYSGFSRRSMYFHYGLFPYIEVTRIIVDSYPTVIYVDQPIYTVYGVRYENSRYPGLDEALGDIRSAWISGRYDLIERHVRNSNDIAVLLDGRYDYSVAPDDYLAMTQDALGEMDSVSWVWDKVQPRRDGTITGFATHTYRSGDAVRKVYVSYTLQKVDGCYYIVEVGSTQVPWN